MKQSLMDAAERAFEDSLPNDNEEECKCDHCSEIDEEGEFVEFLVSNGNVSLFLCEECAEHHRCENWPTGEVL